MIENMVALGTLPRLAVAVFFPSGFDGNAIVSLCNPAGNKVARSTFIHGRLARLFVTIAEARRRDADASGGEYGWRSRERLSAMNAEITRWDLEVQSVSAYAYQLQSQLNALMGNDSMIVVERQRGMGMRIAPGIAVSVFDRGKLVLDLKPQDR